MAAKACLVVASLGSARHGTAVLDWQGRAWLNMARQPRRDTDRLGMARLDTARNCVAARERSVRARLGRAWYGGQGKACRVLAWRDEARQPRRGVAKRGMAWDGQAVGARFG